jgi:small subunit ribosomal protein S16
VGFYDPKAPEGRESLRVNVERVKHWTGKGAQCSATVTRLVKQFGKAKKAA